MKVSIYRPLGAFRLFLALLVVVQHSVHLLAPSQRPILLHAGIGAVSVAVFFMISGFIVAEANATFYKDRPVDFLRNRALRLIPPYLAALIVSVVIYDLLYKAGVLDAWEFDPKGSPTRPSLLLGGLLMILPGFQPKYLDPSGFEYIPIAWSIRIEITFYLAAFLFYWLCKYSKDAAFMLIAFFIVTLAVFLLDGGAGPKQQVFIPFFFLGIALYRLWSDRSIRNAMLYLISLVACFLCYLHWGQRGEPSAIIQLPILFGLISIATALVFIPSISFKALDKKLGALSYPLYLNHYIVIVVLADTSRNYGIGLLVIGVLASLGLSAFMFYLAEKPIKPLRESIRGAAL